jgi:hypothetical protein
MAECRWSGWPGAWCLDCGRDDPRENMLGDNRVDFICELTECKCGHPDSDCDHFRVKFHDPFTLECSEPGSNRHNPYVK